MTAQSNFPSISPLLNFNNGTIDGPTKSSCATWTATYADVEVPLTGEWYWEVITDNYVYAFPGIQKVTTASSQQNHDFAMVQNGQYRYNGNGEADTTNIGTGDIIGIYVNDGAIKVYVNNTLDHTYGTNMSVEGGPYFPSFIGSSHCTVNFGQDSSFLGVKTAQGNTDGNGIGDFYYTPPGNALALCSANAPTSSDIDPAQTDDDYPTKQFNAVAYTGNGSTQSITGLGFRPDMIWYKRRNASNPAVIMDSSRGVSEALEPSSSGSADTNFTQGITSFDTDGFSLGSQTQGNGSGGNLIAWCWRANGGTTAANSDGAISSSVQANTKSGFSIVTFTGLASSNFSSTVGHGLTKAPEFIIHKARDTAGSWWCQHVGLSALTKFLAINSNGAEVNLSGYGSISAPTSSVFSVNGVEGIGGGGSARSYLAYCWHSVEGYSSFGTYVGNANDDGPYIYTGFRPRMVFVKNTEQSGTEWSINDSARNTFNPTEKQLNWDNGNAEVTGKNIDFLSNGFKIRKNTGAMNNDGRVHIYGAWGDVPAKFNNSF